LIISQDILQEFQEDLQGEIYISVDRIRENAAKERVPYREELHRVIFHGTLHLCGYEDKKREEILKMRKKENMYLKKYFEQ